MNTNEYNELMELIEAYGDTCEQFGDYQSVENMLNCGRAKQKISDFLKNFVKNA